MVRVAGLVLLLVGAPLGARASVAEPLGEGAMPEAPGPEAEHQTLHPVPVQTTPEPALTALEAVAGVPAEVAAFVGLALAYAALVPTGLQPGHGLESELILLAAFTLGVPAISSLAVWGVGNLSERYAPSLAFTYFGGVAGSLAALLLTTGAQVLIVAAVGNRIPIAPAIAFFVAAAAVLMGAPVAGEVIACNLTKRPIAKPDRQTAWWQHLEVPLPQVAWGSGQRPQVQFSLLRGSF